MRLCAAAWIVLLAGSAIARGDYPNANAALNAAGPLIRNKQFSAAQEPLEAAFRLAKPEERAKRTAAEGLMVVYRELKEKDKLLETGEFLIRTGERRAGRSIVSNSITSFLHQNGMLDDGIKRYEDLRKANPDDLAALGVLERIYTQSSRKDAAKAKPVSEHLKALNVKLAKDRAEKLQGMAAKDGQLAAWHLKEAAEAWIEADDKAQAIAAAKASQVAKPEQRSTILTQQWHSGLADVFLEAGETQLAIGELEAALESATSEALKAPVQKKLDDAKAKLK